MKIIAGPSSQELGKKISSNLNLPLLSLNFKHFYDGESYLRIDEDINDDEYIIVQSTHPPQEKHLIELMLIAAYLKEKKADKIHAIIPYLCYARADKQHLKGEILSHQKSLKFIETSGVDSVITINVHNREAFLSSENDMEKYDLTCLEYSINQLKQKYEKKWFVIAPDEGRINEARISANILNCDFNYLKKKRDPHTNLVSFEQPDFDITNKDVLVLDDIISSGGTAINAAKIILEQNPASLLMFFIHSLAKNDVFEKLKYVGVNQIISTNTIPNNYIEQIDIALILSNFVEEKFL